MENCEKAVYLFVMHITYSICFRKKIAIETCWQSIYNDPLRFLVSQNSFQLKKKKIHQIISHGSCANIRSIYGIWKVGTATDTVKVTQ